MQEEKVVALLTLAGIETHEIKQIPNRYFPLHPHYDEFRNNSPWWVAVTPFGEIEIGKRLNTISINWEDTSFRGIITVDSVKQDDTKIVAHNYAKAVQYLSTLKTHLKLATA